MPLLEDLPDVNARFLRFLPNSDGSPKVRQLLRAFCSLLYKLDQFLVRGAKLWCKDMFRLRMGVKSLFPGYIEMSYRTMNVEFL